MRYTSCVPKDISMLKDPETVVICKPRKGRAGKGQQILKLKDVTEEMRRKRSIQELISPLLWNGRKFHVRMIYVWVPNRGARLCYNGMVLAGNNHYVPTDFSVENQLTNPRIHHQTDIPDVIQIEDDLFKSKEQRELFHAGLQQITKDFFLKLNEVHHKQSQQGQYDLYGIDVMANEEGKALILEANASFELGGDQKQVRIKQLMFDKAMEFVTEENPAKDNQCHDFWLSSAK